MSRSPHRGPRGIEGLEDHEKLAERLDEAMAILDGHHSKEVGMEWRVFLGVWVLVYIVEGWA